MLILELFGVGGAVPPLSKEGIVIDIEYNKG